MKVRPVKPMRNPLYTERTGRSTAPSRLASIRHGPDGRLDRQILPDTQIHFGYSQVLLGTCYLLTVRHALSA